MAEVAKALGDPIRLQLVDVLRKHAGKVCVCELVPLFDLSQPTVSHHLKVLRDAGHRRLRAPRAVGLLLRRPRGAEGADRMAELTDDRHPRGRARALRRRRAQAAEASSSRLAAEPAASCCGLRAGCGDASRRRGRSAPRSTTTRPPRRRPARRRSTRRSAAAYPTAVADLHEGETVLDLGSGAGADVLISARRVGPTGRAIGLDMTDEMLALARANARRGRRRQRRVPQGLHRGASRCPTTASTS